LQAKTGDGVKEVFSAIANKLTKTQFPASAPDRGEIAATASNVSHISLTPFVGVVTSCVAQSSGAQKEEGLLLIACCLFHVFETTYVLAPFQHLGI